MQGYILALHSLIVLSCCRYRILIVTEYVNNFVSALKRGLFYVK